MLQRKSSTTKKKSFKQRVAESHSKAVKLTAQNEGRAARVWREAGVYQQLVILRYLGVSQAVARRFVHSHFNTFDALSRWVRRRLKRTLRDVKAKTALSEHLRKLGINNGLVT